MCSSLRASHSEWNRDAGLLSLYRRIGLGFSGLMYCLAKEAIKSISSCSLSSSEDLRI